MGLLDYTISDKKYFNSGREYERERIIKLLEEHLGNMDWDDLLELIENGSNKQELWQRILSLHIPMAEDVDLKSIQCQFESDWRHSPLQLSWLEQTTHNRSVTGSSPVEGTKIK